MDAVPLATLVRPGAVLRFAWPAMLKEVSTILPGVVSTICMGMRSKDFLAAFAIAQTIERPIGWMFNFLVLGVTAEIGQAFGKRAFNEIKARAELALRTALYAGFVIGIILASLSHVIIPFLTENPILKYEVIAYYRIMMLLLCFRLMLFACIGVLQGLQRIKTAAAAQIVYVSVDLGLTFFFIVVAKYSFLWSAVATGLGQVLGCGVAAIGLIPACRAADIKIQLVGKSTHGTDVTLKGFFQSNIWLFLRSSVLQISFFINATIMIRNVSEAAVSAYQVISQLWLFVSYLVDGFAVIANAVGSRIIGELSSTPAVMKRTFSQLIRSLVLWTVLSVGVLAALLLIFPDKLLSVFTSDASVTKFCKDVYLYLVLLQPMNCLVFLYDGFLLAGKHNKYIAFAMTLSATLMLPAEISQMFFSHSLAKTYWALLALFFGRLVTGLLKVHSNNFFSNSSEEKAPLLGG